MTISTLLAELAEQYGLNRPQCALDRYCYLDRMGTSRARTQNEQYCLLRKWLTETLEAGSAFKQSRLVEH